MKYAVVVLLCLSILLNSGVTVFAQAETITIWNENGQLSFYPSLVTDTLCGESPGGWEYIEFTSQGGERVHGWADDIRLDCDHRIYDVPNIPGLASSESFGDQCDEYTHVYDEAPSGFSGPVDLTICKRRTPEAPIAVAASIRLSALDREPNTGTSETRQHMERQVDPILETINYGSGVDPNNPLGGPANVGGGAAFWWDDVYHFAFQPWGSSTYYVVNGLGDLWKIPHTAITTPGYGRYVIHLVSGWEAEWRVDPENEVIDGAYIPTPRAPDQYPERSLFRHDNVVAGQRQWLMQYGRPGWEAIAAALPTEDAPPVAYWRMSVVLSVEEELFAIQADSTILLSVNGRRIYPEVQDGWYVFPFTLEDHLVVRNQGEVLLDVDNAVISLSDGHFLLGRLYVEVRQPGLIEIRSVSVRMWFDEEVGQRTLYSGLQYLEAEVGVYTPIRPYNPPDPDSAST